MCAFSYVSATPHADIFSSCHLWGDPVLVSFALSLTDGQMLLRFSNLSDNLVTEIDGYTQSTDEQTEATGAWGLPAPQKTDAVLGLSTDCLAAHSLSCPGLHCPAHSSPAPEPLLYSLSHSTGAKFFPPPQLWMASDVCQMHRCGIQDPLISSLNSFLFPLFPKHPDECFPDIYPG